MKGWLHLETEAHCLLQTAPGPGKNALLSEVVSVTYDNSQLMNLKKLNDKNVVIYGTFYKNIIGKGRLLAGACNVTGVKIKSVSEISSEKPSEAEDIHKADSH
jgi:hypothetical protein